MSAYQSILAVLADVSEEPEATAIAILTALRSIPDEVNQAGVDSGQWKQACEAMIATANEADNIRLSREANVRRQAWPEMRRRLEKSGCEVTHRDVTTWRVAGTGVSIDIDLGTGDIEHSNGELGEQLPEFEDIADHIVRTVVRRQAHKADLAQRRERRKSHQFDNRKKVWLPRSGIGPVIPQGQ